MTTHGCEEYSIGEEPPLTNQTDACLHSRQLYIVLAPAGGPRRIGCTRIWPLHYNTFCSPSTPNSPSSASKSSSCFCFKACKEMKKRKVSTNDKVITWRLRRLPKFIQQKKSKIMTKTTGTCQKQVYLLTYSQIQVYANKRRGQCGWLLFSPESGTCRVYDRRKRYLSAIRSPKSVIFTAEKRYFTR